MDFVRTRKTLKTVLVVSAMLIVWAQPWTFVAQAPQPATGVKYSQVSADDLKEWLTYLASDELLGRQVFTEGYGLAAQYMLLPNGDGYPAISVNGGAHWIQPAHNGTAYGGLDGTFTVSETVYEQVVYGGYDLDLDWPPYLNHNSAHQWVFAGAKLVVSEHLHFFIEGGFALRNEEDPTPYYVSGGPVFVFGAP